MAAPGVDVGTGTEIVFGTSGFTAEVTGLDMSGVSREVLETSHLSTPPSGANEIGSKTYLAGDLSDPGELSIEGHLNPDTVPPVEGPPETITITFPIPPGGVSGAIWTFQGQMTNYEWGVPTEDLMTFSATVKATGKITVAAAV